MSVQEFESMETEQSKPLSESPSKEDILLKDRVGHVVLAAQEAIREKIVHVQEFCVEAGGKLDSKANAIVEAVDHTFTSARTKASQITDSLAESASTAASSARETITTAAKDAKDSVSRQAGVARGSISTTASTARLAIARRSSDAKEIIGDAAEASLAAAGRATDHVVAAARAAGEKITSIVHDALHGAKDTEMDENEKPSGTESDSAVPPAAKRMKMSSNDTNIDSETVLATTAASVMDFESNMATADKTEKSL